MKKAILFGASGLIGSSLLDQLLNCTHYDQVTVVVRKKLKAENKKLKTVVGDFQSLPILKEQLQGDDVFIALGKTKKKTPQENEYYKIDHDYPVLAAKLAKENGATSVFLVSSVGANIQSKAFYVRTKGEAERDIIALNYEHTNVFRPSMLLGHREESRPLERLLVGLAPAINPLLVGAFRAFRGIQSKDVAAAMVTAAQLSSSQKVKIYEWQEMMTLISSIADHDSVL